MSQSNLAKMANPVSTPDIYAACRDFVLAYALPDLEPENVLPGWEDITSLSSGLNEFAVISISQSTQHGSTLENFTVPAPEQNGPGYLTLRGLIEVQVQIDFYAANETAWLRAQRLALVTRSSLGNLFFSDYGLSALSAGDVQKLEPTGETTELPGGYSIIIHLSLTTALNIETEYFDTVNLARLGNIDGVHKQ